MKPEANDTKLKKRLENIHKNIKPMKDEKFRLSEINLDYIQKELLTQDFMEKHTSFKNFSEMARSGSFKVDNEIEFQDVIESGKWNAHVAENSDFNDWNGMLTTAVIERATRKLSL